VPEAIDLAAVFRTFTEPWAPRTVAQINDYDVRIARMEGDFTWHSHPETDEFFLVLEGSLSIRLSDGQVTMRPGQAYVVPRGTPHQPTSAGAQVLLIEPRETVNTGDNPGPLTAPRRVL
jgi:mannose-6-phosphate isomerase-like protein (cupin superfamily)